ncbi:hypothetical protein JL720_16817 [Aureococcus anophagefferens]|nr:hypothetical protein JL720_16817 [Aureococcus anophagefferens]
MRAPVVVETRKEERPTVAEPEPAVAEEPEPVVVRPAVAVSPAPAPTVYRSGWSNADRAADSVKRHTYSADYKQGTFQFLPSGAPKVKLAPKKAKAAVEEEAKAAVEEKPAVVEAAAPAAEEETSVEEERARGRRGECEGEVLPVEYAEDEAPEPEYEDEVLPDEEDDDDEEEDDDDDDELDEETLISTVVAGHETPAKAEASGEEDEDEVEANWAKVARRRSDARASLGGASEKKAKPRAAGWAAAWDALRAAMEKNEPIGAAAEDLASDGRVLSDDEKEVFCDLMAKHDFGSDAAAPDFPRRRSVAALAKAPPAPVAADASDLFASLDAEAHPRGAARTPARATTPAPSEEAAPQQSLRLAVVKAIRTVAAEELESEVTQFHKETGLYRIDSKVVPKKRMKSLLKARARDFAKGAQKGEMKWQLKQRPKLDDWLATAVDLVVKIKQTDVVKRSKFAFCGGFDHYEIEDCLKCFLLQGAFFTGIHTNKAKCAGGKMSV